jgi:tungstate transport system permease protein
VDVLWDAISSAVDRLVHGDRETLDVLLLSLRVSLVATAVAFLAGAPIGAAVALGRFPGRRLALALLNTGMGIPPLVAGLFVTILLWRSGPLGSLGLLYSPAAMTIAQTLIALPLVAGISAAALQQVDPEFRLQMRGLGAGRWRSLWAVAVEARLPLLASVMAGFGAAISEVGAAIMVGGNIKDETRVLTTAAVLETSKGNFGLALAFGIILLVVAFVVNLLLTTVQQRGRPEGA